jgi:hypothetical protein
VGSWRGARRLSAVLLACSLALACDRQADRGPDVSVAWDLEPVPPVAGMPGLARLTLRDPAKQPITGARLRLEGHMSHPGMAPVLSAMSERDPGSYEAPLEFTMAGDWILVVTGDLPGIGRITRQIEVVGVRPAS